MECSVDGCDKPIAKKSFCNAHYLRWWRHGDPLAGAMPKGEARDYVYVAAKHDGSECLIWPYGKNAYGRGVVNRRGKVLQSAREVCRLSHGEPPHSHYHAAHSCGNGHLGCVNPAHLRWASPEENGKDKISHGTSLRGSLNPRSILTEAIVLEARTRYDTGAFTFASLGREYGVSSSTIKDAIRGVNWKHIDG